MVNFDVQTHHKHVSLTGHLLGIALLLVNRARYDALPAESRAALNAAARDSEATQRSLAIAEDTECLRTLADAGVAIVPSHEIDLAAFRHVATGT
jgi:TRAP-type C4-dicarboxylate transport system substrate-binding protein